MKHLSHWEELEPGDRIFTTHDHFKWVGGPLYCFAGTVLIVLDVNQSGCKACPEGGSDVGHYFTGLDDLESLRLSSKKILHSMQKTVGKTTKKTKTKTKK